MCGMDDDDEMKAVAKSFWREINCSSAFTSVRLSKFGNAISLSF